MKVSAIVFAGSILFAAAGASASGQRHRHLPCTLGRRLRRDDSAQGQRRYPVQSCRRAVRHLEKGRVVIFAAGTGNPYFTTDTAAALRAMEIKAEVILKGTKVDGVYTADPMLDPTATKYSSISYLQVLERQLKVMDATAISLCMDNKLPIVVFNLREPGNIRRVVLGEAVGTTVGG